ncbi:MAG: hypothetical protein IJ212_01915 [Bacteroidaceae bacterium]|nr:hypothetical protein [Bacteroidaceae bacterium]
MKKFLLLLCLLTGVVNVVAQKISILGDSYSTFEGHVSPAWNFCWYGTDDKGKLENNDIRTVDQTWWSIVLKETGYELVKNNSFSGSTVCFTGYDGEDYSDRAFITRMNNLSDPVKGEPDIILVLGGTNDSWAGSPMGYFTYSNITRVMCYSFRPAFCYMMDYLKKNYPKARIINICNSELSTDITETQAEVCRHFGIENVQLQNIEKQWGHPSIAGMKAIAEQVLKVLKK